MCSAMRARTAKSDNLALEAIQLVSDQMLREGPRPSTRG